jgi:protease II
MNLPKVVTELIKAQNNFDSAAYANCFTETAEVFDEGKTHTGKTEIKIWIDKANKEYQAKMEPIAYQESAGKAVLNAKISGTFEGSPIVLSYHFDFAENLIQSLKITG